MKKEIILVSACLLGTKCRYDGKDNLSGDVVKLRKYFDMIPICPETDGGLKIPRTPSEIRGDIVVSKSGADVTEYFDNGAYLACAIAQMYKIRLAVLKEKSPSCGCKLIHNGSFDGTIVEGQGITAKRLKKNGVVVIDEDDASLLLTALERGEKIDYEDFFNRRQDN